MAFVKGEKRVRSGESEIIDRDSVEVEGDEGMRVGNDGLHFNGVDKWFGEGCLFEGRVIEAPDIVPD